MQIYTNPEQTFDYPVGYAFRTDGFSKNEHSAGPGIWIVAKFTNDRYGNGRIPTGLFHSGSIVLQTTIKTPGISHTMVNAETAVEELTFVLLYLTRMKEKYGGYSSWKGYDFPTLDRLEEKGLILQGRNKTITKSVFIPEESVAKAKELLEKYGIDDWE
jgi:hypothetical protein